MKVKTLIKRLSEYEQEMTVVSKEIWKDEICYTKEVSTRVLPLVKNLGHPFLQQQYDDLVDLGYEGEPYLYLGY